MNNLSRAKLLIVVCLSASISSRLEARTWTSAQGQYKIEAEFVEHRSDGKVILRRPDGSIIAVEVTKLSSADQKYVEELEAAAQASPDSIDGLLLASRQLLRDGRLSQASDKIEQANAKATSAAERQQVAAVQDLSRQLTQFWAAVAEAGSRLTGGAEMEIGRATVAVVESSANRLVLRALGKNCRFALDRPETIPSSLALELAKRRLAGSEAAKIIAAYEGLGPEANNRRLWELAAGGPLVTAPLSDIANGPPVSTQPKTSTTPDVPSGNTVTPNLPSSTPLTPPDDPQLGVPKKREPVPAASVIAKQRKEIRELFANDFKAATPKEKYDLAKKLFQLAQETLVDEPVAAYVLYVEAVELAAGVGDAIGASQILDQINASFDDGAIASRRADALATAIKVTDPPLSAPTIRFVGERASQLIDEAIAAEDFSAARSAVDTAIVVARRMKDRTAQAMFQKRQKEISDREKAFGAIIAAREAVAKDPTDAQANRTLAIYYCARQNDWDEGLTFLAKLDNPDIVRAAERDLEEPTEEQECYELAETWWSLGEKDATELGPALMRRAAHWYEQALPGLSALKKVKAQKRIEEAAQLDVETASDAIVDAKPVLLTSLPLAGSQGVDTSRRGTLHCAVNISGKAFTNGIWAQPQRDTTARIGYTLDKDYSSLTGVVGMDDSMPLSTAYSSVVFSIYNDKGKLLWSSAPLKRRGAGQAFNVKVQGVQTLYLVTQLSDTSNSYCYAVWGDLTLAK